MSDPTRGFDDRARGFVLPPGVQAPGGASPDGTDSRSLEQSDRRQAPQKWSEVPWRTIVATIGLVAVAALLAVVMYITSRVVIWILVAGFFAVVLARPVRWLEHRFGLRRGAATSVAVITTLVVVAGLVTVFVLPVRSQLVAVMTDLPGTVQQAADGQGPVGHLVTQLHLQQLVRNHEPQLTRTAKSLENSLPGLIGTAITFALALLTVAVMTFLMLTQAGNLARAGIRLVPMRHRDWARNVGRDAAAAVSGYMIGNLILSVCAGAAAFVLLLILGVPSPAVLALWVAFADLIPLVGATLGAVVAVIAAFFVSSPAGIAAIIFFALYQQFENSVLQIAIMSRAVKVSPLVVLLSLLLGVELFGPIGALLAVPIAGAGSVVTKELWRHRPPSAHDLVVIGNSSDALAEVAPTEGHRWPHLGRKRRSRKQEREQSHTDHS